jgi:phospholipid-binding lipoprotein MlaA
LVLRKIAFAALVGMGLQAAPALAQTAAPPATVTGVANPDPWEATNRGFYSFENGLDHVALRPAAVFYKHALPHPVRNGVHNMLGNLTEPVTFFNNVLQARPRKAVRTLARLTLNSTVGIGGIFDVGAHSGLPRERTGFADTLARYGAPQGPYLFLPLLGPSSVRDVTGRIGDAVMSPFTWVKFDGRDTLQVTTLLVDGLDQRSGADPILKSINHTATDPYATIRAAFLQTTSTTGDKQTDVKALPDFGPEPSSRPAPGAPTSPTPHD